VEIYVGELLVSGVGAPDGLQFGDAFRGSLTDAIAHGELDGRLGVNLTLDSLSDRHIALEGRSASELGRTVAKAVSDVLREVELP
jgi:hypothetical protein